MKTSASLRLTSFALAALLAAPLAAQAQNIAIVNGKAVPKARVEALMTQAVKSGQPKTPELEQQVRDEVVLREIFLQEAEKRGLATGVVNAGGSFGQFLFAPIAGAISAAAGWRSPRERLRSTTSTRSSICTPTATRRAELRTGLPARAAPARARRRAARRPASRRRGSRDPR